MKKEVLVHKKGVRQFSSKQEVLVLEKKGVPDSGDAESYS